MMRKWKKFLAILSIGFILLSMILPTMSVAAATNDSLANGEYTIGFKVLKDGTDSISVMDDYTEKPASLFNENGKYFIEMTLKHSDWIVLLQTKQNGAFVDVEVVSSDTENDTRVVRFPIENLEDKLDMYTHVVIPMLKYDNYYTVQVQFDPNSLTPVNIESPTDPEEPADPEVPTNPTDPEEPVEPGEPTDPTGPTDPEAPELLDGAYSIEFSAMHATEEKPSTMQGYLGKPARLDVVDGKSYVSLEIIEKPGQQITDLRLENNGALNSGELVSKDEAALKRVVKYEVDNIATVINAEVDMHVPAANYSNTQKFRVAFDIDSIVELEAPTEPEQPEQPTEPTDPEEPTEPQAPELSDGAYTIDISALHATQDKESSMKDYLGNPARLDVIDGKTYVSLEIIEKPGQLITDLRLASNGEFHSGELISKDEAALKRVVKYEVDNIATVINAEVDMHVPAANYSNTQKFRVAFDIDSIDEFEAPTEPEQPEQPGDEIAIGEYSIDFKVLKDGTNDISVMDGYTGKPAKLTVNEDGQYIDITLKSSDWIKLFQTKQNGALVDAEVISEDTEANTRVVRFPIENLEEKLDAYTHVVIPTLNYDNYYTVQLQFDASALVPNEDEEQEEIQEPIVENQNGTKTLVVKDVKNFSYDKTKKVYELVNNGVSAFHISADIFEQFEADASVSLAIGDGITAIFPVQLFLEQVKAEGGFVFSFNEVGQMEGSLSKLYDFTVKIGTKTVTEFTKPITLVFDMNQQLVKSWNNVKVVYVNDAGEKAEVLNPTAVDQQNGKVSAEVMHFSAYGVFEVEPEVNEEKGLADGQYFIDFKVLKDKTDDASVMDGYTEKPAILNVKDGQYKIDLTLTSSDWIKQFQVQENGTYLDAVVVSENTAEDKRVVRFGVADLTEKVNAKTHVVIPDINYDNHYVVQFKFDVNNITDENGNKVEYKPNPTTKPGDDNQPSDDDENKQPSNDDDDDLNYDRDSDGKGSNDSKDNKSTNNGHKVSNAKTGDISMITLFLSLLIGSGIWLIRKYRLKSL